MGNRTPQKIIFILLLFISASIYSQQNEYIIGKLLDIKTQEPIVFASIRIKGRALGVISNEDGSFKIPLKYKNYGDIIEISSMGYQSTEILINDLQRYEVNMLRLQPAVLELEETVVLAKSKRKKVLSARKIVRKAIEAIPQNFPETSFSTIGYYRDYQMKDQVHINLNEAILEVFDEGFDQLDLEKTKVKIYDYKQNLDFYRDSLPAMSYDYINKSKVVNNAFLPSYGGNEFVILRVHDAIRNFKMNSYDYVNNLETDLLKHHNFEKEEDTYLEDEALYTISISKVISGYGIYGRLFISKRDFAIHKMEYELFDLYKKDVLNSLNTNNSTWLMFKVVTEYKRANEKMYLNYISFQNSFEVARPSEFIVNEIIANTNSKCFEVRFNRPIDPTTAGNKKNYKFKFLGKKIRFNRIVVFEDAVRLFPDMSVVRTNSMFDQIVQSLKKNQEIDELLETRVEGILTFNANDSTSGMLLNEPKKEDYLQFREYFVQQLKVDATAPLDSLFMDKKRPIFKDQPVVKPDNFDDYWMNTPLKKVN